MENEISLTNYIAAWNWQIISLMFLIASFILITIQQSLSRDVFTVAFFLIFASCQYMSMKRRKEFYDENS